MTTRTLARSPALLTVAASSLVLGSFSAQAGMTLDAASSRLSLLSTKVLGDGASSVAERHVFDDLSGSVSDAGEANVEIDLTSIQTGIDIRNERMQEMLFETDEFPTATISATVPDSATADGVQTMDLQVSVDLHGATQELTVPVVITGENGGVTVTSVEPVLLDASAFDLGGGIQQLTEVAGLLHIPMTVPVSFSLKFTADEAS